MAFAQNAHFHPSAPLMASAAAIAATGGGASSSVVEVTPTRGGCLSYIYIRLTASRAVVTSTDAIYVLGHETSSATGIRYRETYSDTDPANLLAGFDGETDIDLIFPFREGPYNSLQFVTSGSAITFTADADITIQSPTR